MKNRLFVFLDVILLLTGVISARLQADHSQKTLIITMTNDSVANAVVVIDAATNAHLQTIATNGKGGVGQNAGGVKQYHGRLVAAVNMNLELSRYSNVQAIGWSLSSRS